MEVTKMNQYHLAADYIRNKMGVLKPRIAVILGSGLGVLAEEFSVKIPYQEIPGFPISTVEGHAGELLVGDLNSVPVIAMNGRFHYYEGYDLSAITFPVRVFKLLGIDVLLVTNAAGGINQEFQPGDFMVINDHLSFFCPSVLRGANDDSFGERFLAMTDAYDTKLRRTMKSIILHHTGRTSEGVYAFMKGPTYETPAEINALRALGADAVGMSTVPEVIVARHAGMRVCAVTCITNMAAGISTEPISHGEVTNTANLVKDHFKNIIKEFLTCFDQL